MAKLSSFNPLNAELNPLYHLLALLEAHHILHVSRTRVNRERLALGFEVEFWSLKHPNSPSEAVEESKQMDKEVSSTENMLAAACVEFGTEIGEEMEGQSMWLGRGVSIRVEDEGNLL